MGNAVAKWGSKATIAPAVKDLVVGLDHGDMCCIWDHVMLYASSPAVNREEFDLICRLVPAWTAEEGDSDGEEGEAKVGETWEDKKTRELEAVFVLLRGPVGGGGDGHGESKDSGDHEASANEAFDIFEFLCACVVLSKLTMDEKIAFAFMFFDTTGIGKGIDHEGMLIGFRSALRGTCVGGTVVGGERHGRRVLRKVVGMDAEAWTTVHYGDEGQCAQ